MNDHIQVIATSGTLLGVVVGEPWRVNNFQQRPLWLIVQLPVQSVPITSNVVSSILVHGDVYLIQHYVINFACDLWQVSAFLRVL